MRIFVIAVSIISGNDGAAHEWKTACPPNISMNTGFPHILKGILPVLAIVLAGACADPEPQRPPATRGNIDLSGHDFVHDGGVDLRGEWEFYRMRLIPPEELTEAGGAGDPDFQNIPRRWNPRWKMYLPSHARGYATYRLRVTVGDARPEPMGMRIGRIPSAYRLYVNGHLISKSGRVGTSPESTVPHYTESVAPLPRADGIYDVVVHVANYHAPVGGFDTPIVLGDFASLRKSEQTRSSLAVFIASVLLMLSFFQFLLYSFQRTERHYLYFGLMYLLMMVYTVGLHSAYWSGIVPFLTWGPVYSAMAMAVYLWGAFAVAFLQRLFPLEVPRRAVSLVFAVNGTLAAAMAVLPARWFAYLFPVLHIDSVIVIALCVYIIIRAALNRREFAMYAVLGLLVMIFAALLDIISAAEMIPDDVDYLPWGIALYCVIQTVGMARDFIRIQHRSRKLAVDNEKLRAAFAGRMRAGQSAVSGEIETKINAAVGYLRENFAGEIARENLAATLDLHPDSFSRYFKMHTGKKYSEFLNDLRVAEAVRLLTRTDQPVITIAMNVGFNSLRTFNHAFLAATGKKPSDFRRQS